jgi:hypothetical protein
VRLGFCSPIVLQPSTIPIRRLPGEYPDTPPARRISRYAACQEENSSYKPLRLMAG